MNTEIDNLRATCVKYEKNYDQIRSRLILKKEQKSQPTQIFLDTLDKIKIKVYNNEEKINSVEHLIDFVIKNSEEQNNAIQQTFKYLKDKEISWKEKYNYVPYHESLEPSSPNNETIDNLPDLVSPSSKQTKSATMISALTQTPNQTYLLPMSVKSERKSEKKIILKSNEPDWVHQATEISFTPGLFPLASSCVKSSGKYPLTAKHLKF